MFYQKTRIFVVVSLLMVVCMVSLQPSFAQTIPTRTPTPNAQPPTATSQPAATATSDSGGGQNPTPVPPTATASSGGQNPTPVPPTAVSGGETPAPVNPTATAVSYPGLPDSTATAAPAAAGGGADGYPAPPSANPVTTGYPEPAESSQNAPAPEDESVVKVVGEEAVEEETAVAPTPEPTSAAPNVLPLVGLVLLAAGVFGLIFWRRQQDKA